LILEVSHFLRSVGIYHVYAVSKLYYSSDYLTEIFIYYFKIGTLTPSLDHGPKNIS
jgi:hypothetical protein